MKVLIVNGSPREENSTGTLMANHLATKIENADITRINTFDLGLEAYSKGYMADFYNPNKIKTENDIKQDEIRMNLYKQFEEAEEVIISMPIYNFSYSEMMKMYVDALFQYQVSYDPSKPTGEKGLFTKNKNIRVIVTHGNDGYYGQASLSRTIRDMFEYAGLHYTTWIADFYSVHAKTPEELKLEVELQFKTR